MLLTEIEWDAPEVLARSLPQKVYIVNYPGVEPDDKQFQRFMRARFGAGTTGCVGYAHGQLTEMVLRRTNNRLTVELVVWEEILC